MRDSMGMSTGHDIPCVGAVLQRACERGDGEGDPSCVSAVEEVADRTQKWLSVKGTRSVDWFHRELGKLVWNFIGMERDKNGL